MQFQGVSIGNALKSDQHISRISAKWTEEGKISLIQSFIDANYNHCPWAWYFCSNKCTANIESIQKMVLLLLYNDFEGGCSQLSDQANEREMTVGRLCYLFTKLYQAVNHPTGFKELEFVIRGDFYRDCLIERSGACMERKECASC